MVVCGNTEKDTGGVKNEQSIVYQCVSVDDNYSSALC